MTTESGPQAPGDGEVYLATDGRWYRWPNPTSYQTREAAEARDAWAVTALPASTGSAAAPPGEPTWYAPPATPPTGVTRAAAYLAALLVAGPILVGAVAWLVLPKDVESGCEGIGFGCTLSPSSTAVLTTFYVLLFTVPGVGVAAVAMRILTSRWSWYRELRPLTKAVVVVLILAAPLALIRVVGLLYYALIDR